MIEGHRSLGAKEDSSVALVVLSVCLLCADRSQVEECGRGKTYRIKGFRLLSLREVRRKRCRGEATL
jgi:hypothetical protein